MPQNSKIHVVSVLPGLAKSRGGPSFSVSSLCDACAAVGVNQTLMVPEPPPGEPECLPSCKDVSTIRVPCIHWEGLNLLLSPSFRQTLRQHCLATRVKVLHNHGLWTQPNHAAAKVARELDLPMVVSTHGMVASWALRHKAWKKRLGYWLYQRRDLEQACVIRATAEPEALAIRELGFRQPIAIIPNGIEIPEPAQATHEKCHRVALFVGRIYPVKGLLNLVKAWATVRPQNWRCIIAGPDEAGHRKEVEATVRDAGLGRDFAFPGAVTDDEKGDLYRSADLFVLPSFTENFGLVVAEALACGVPVITTRGTPWESLHHHDCGWWVELGVEPLAAALKEATALSDAKRREMGQRGRDFVTATFSWPKIGQNMVAVYRWILGQGERPECVIS